MITDEQLAAIQKQIEGDFYNDDDGDKIRRDRARVNFAFYLGDFSEHDPRDVIECPDRAKPRDCRTTPLMQRAVDVLTANLYAKGPAREIHDARPASLWLAERYAAMGADAAMQAADQLAMVADVAAIQVQETGDAGEPIRFQVWPAHEFSVWFGDDDPVRPIAVATLDQVGLRRRVRLWTEDELLTFWTGEATGTAGGTAYELFEREPHDFGLVPFAFVHARPPATRFWSGGVGDALRELNDCLNVRMTEIGEDLRYMGSPVVLVMNAGETWRAPTPRKPGDVWYVPCAGIDALGNGIPPEVRMLAADLGGVEIAWEDLQSYLDQVLMAVNIPPAAIRLELSSTQSGAAIVAEQLPVLMWAAGRQRPFAGYERDLARAALAVGRAATGRAELDPAHAAGLTLRWPGLVPDVPLFGQSQDDEDSRLLALGITSRTMIVMRRLACDRDTALAHLKQVAEDARAEEAAGLAPVAPPALPSPSEGDSET